MRCTILWTFASETLKKRSYLIHVALSTGSITLLTAPLSKYPLPDPYSDSPHITLIHTHLNYPHHILPCYLPLSNQEVIARTTTSVHATIAHVKPPPHWLWHLYSTNEVWLFQGHIPSRPWMQLPSIYFYFYAIFLQLPWGGTLLL